MIAQNMTSYVLSKFFNDMRNDIIYHIAVLNKDIIPLAFLALYEIVEFSNIIYDTSCYHVWAAPNADAVANVLGIGVQLKSDKLESLLDPSGY